MPIVVRIATVAHSDEHARCTKRSKWLRARNVGLMRPRHEQCRQQPERRRQPAKTTQLPQLSVRGVAVGGLLQRRRDCARRAGRRRGCRRRAERRRVCSASAATSGGKHARALPSWRAVRSAARRPRTPAASARERARRRAARGRWAGNAAAARRGRRRQRCRAKRPEQESRDHQAPPASGNSMPAMIAQPSAAHGCTYSSCATGPTLAEVGRRHVQAAARDLLADGGRLHFIALLHVAGSQDLHALGVGHDLVEPRPSAGRPGPCAPDSRPSTCALAETYSATNLSMPGTTPTCCFFT